MNKTEAHMAMRHVDTQRLFLSAVWRLATTTQPCCVYTDCILTQHLNELTCLPYSLDCEHDL